ncbi:hypothetical protein FT663_02739 [Candidozyma haemuli var. vulneris]|uniref:C2H2-type domain-containing protein n=1 Tax=Candidozyma haemuli TaxID=45357 RepID=A0A2V1AMX7_9ASCO|nr:hypothetical protein CXQ85_001443 [[Candida] haemuloni]KAF3989645.1 hypothetical protein FT662_02724 [[Candida] haemuloni var. vulneris]KAF3991441.1 hypothetical protein FT663_02739 [[Candida] haemuloni var. vulneris]PVH19145.1 hypothetical protein CXQ85_001443 [[Candida] haemuloni]
MDPYWDEISFAPKPRTPAPEEEFSQYFSEYKNFDNLFNEALTTLQDLDVPSGPVQPAHIPHGLTSPFKHSKKPSGTAIFGYADHNRELSINGMNNEFLKHSRVPSEATTSISPVQLARKKAPPPMSNDHLDFNFSQPLEACKPIHINEDDEYNEVKPPKQKEDDFIVTGATPKQYKFPPDPEDEDFALDYLKKMPSVSQPIHISAKEGAEPYPEEIESLLESSPSRKPKYVPIPVNQPAAPRRKSPLRGPQDHHQHHPDIDPNLDMDMNMNMNMNMNVYLPPPGSQTDSVNDYSSPEPASPALPQAHINHMYSSPQRMAPPQAPSVNSSPFNNKKNFCNPQFFSDGTENSENYYSEPSVKSSPFQSSPFRNTTEPRSLKSSPLRQNRTANDTCPDETVTDVNETIVQLTPLKNSTTPFTPSKNKITLEWSPIISPNSKATSDVRKAIQELSPKKVIKKTSLLPPGELDRYWVGPDEDKIFTCTYEGCNKKFTRRYNVRSHIQTHLSDRPFTCSYCPKSFVRQHDLNRHIKSHLVTKHCKCSCGKEFTRVEGYKRHLAKGICQKGTETDLGGSSKGISKPSPTKLRRGEAVLDGLTSNRLNEDLGFKQEH